MPLVAPATPSPPSLSTSNAKMSVSSPSRATSTTTEQVHTTPPAKESQPMIEEVAPRFPTATLEVDSISDVMAARLAICLLGHVLFLKSQVPFPVAQLLKMKSKKTDSRANKKHDALLESFDLLSSHLGSTFSALAAALSFQTEHAIHTPAAHLAIVLGPSATSASAARARVVLELDGLRVASSSRRTNRNQIAHARSQLGENGHLKENGGVRRVFKEDGESAPLSVRPKGLGLQDTFSRGLGLSDVSRSDVRAEVTSGRSDGSKLPSQPSVLSRGLRDTSRSSIQASDASDDSDEREDEDELSESDIESVPPESDMDSSSDLEVDGDDEEGLSDIEDESKEEADLLAAERLLSRTLAIANSDPEQGMAAEIRPTQTHILLRAPRRFAHPSWIPRQNLTRDMDPVLRAFDEPTPNENALHDITNGSPNHSRSGKEKVSASTKRALKGPGGIKTECVRIRCRDRLAHKTEQSGLEQNVSDENEEDAAGSEMIWWSWDGKLEGFADW